MKNNRNHDGDKQQFTTIPTLSPIRSKTLIQATIAQQNTSRMKRYGSSTALVINQFVLKEASIIHPTLLPLPLRIDIERSENPSTQQNILYPSSVAIPIETGVPQPHTAVDDQKDSFTSALSSTSTVTSPQPYRRPPNLRQIAVANIPEPNESTVPTALPVLNHPSALINHHNQALMNFYKKKKQTSIEAYKIASKAYRNKMIEHRIRAIHEAREGIRAEDAHVWEKQIRKDVTPSEQEKDEDEDLHSNTQLTNAGAQRRAKFLLYGTLPGTRHRVKKSMHTSNYKLNEYWRQMDAQRALGIRAWSLQSCSDANQKKQKQKEKEIKKDKEKTDNEEASEQDQIITKKDPTPHSIHEVDNILDLFLFIVWRVNHYKQLWAFHKFTNNVKISKLKHIMRMMLHVQKKKAFAKWIHVDFLVKQQNGRRMKRALSITQIHPVAWRKNLLKQLIVKKLLYSMKAIQLRNAFESWCDCTESGDRHSTLYRDRILNNASQYYTKRNNEEDKLSTKNKSEEKLSNLLKKGQQSTFDVYKDHTKHIDRRNRLPSTMSTSRSTGSTKSKSTRDRSLSSMSTKSRASRSKSTRDRSLSSMSTKSTKSTRRMSIKEQAPKQMFQTMKKVEAKSMPQHYYKNTGMTTEELLDFALGKKNKQKAVNAGKMPSNQYFLENARKSQDSRFRQQKVKHGITSGKLWCR